MTIIENIKKGDQIEQIKESPFFETSGKLNVMDVIYSTDGSELLGITFSGVAKNPYGNLMNGFGGLNPSELNEYFQIVEPEKPELEVIEYVDEETKIKTIYLGEESIIVILPDGSKGKSTCSPNDEYDVEIGYTVALARAETKSLKKQIFKQKQELKNKQLEIEQNISKLKKKIKKQKYLLTKF